MTGAAPYPSLRRSRTKLGVSPISKGGQGYRRIVRDHVGRTAVVLQGYGLQSYSIRR